MTVDVGTTEISQIDDEIERLGAWLGDIRVKWRYPTPITNSSAPEQQRALDARPPGAGGVPSESSAVGGHLERSADPSHSRTAERADSFDEHRIRDRLDRVEVHRAATTDRIFVGFQNDLARKSSGVLGSLSCTVRSTCGAVSGSRHRTTARRAVDDRSPAAHTTTTHRAWALDSRGRGSVAERREIAPFVLIFQPLVLVGRLVRGIDLR